VTKSKYSHATRTSYDLQNLHTVLETLVSRVYVSGKSRRSTLKADIDQLSLLFNSIFASKDNDSYELEVIIDVKWKEKQLT